MPRLHHLGFLGQCQLYGLYWIPHSHHDLTFLAFSHPSTISPIAVCCLLWHHITVRDVFSFLPCKICSWYLYQRRRSVHRATEIKAWEQDLAYSHRREKCSAGLIPAQRGIKEMPPNCSFNPSMYRSQEVQYFVSKWLDQPSLLVLLLLLLLWFYWSIADSQCCVRFGCTANWTSYTHAHTHPSWLVSHQAIIEYWAEFPELRSTFSLVISLIREYQ